MKRFSSALVHLTGRLCNSVETNPLIRRVNLWQLISRISSACAARYGTHGSSSYNHARQNPGIRGFGTATPQKSAKMMIKNGFSRTAINVLDVHAATVWPSVTANSSVISTTKKKYPAFDGSGSKPRKGQRASQTRIREVSKIPLMK